MDLGRLGELARAPPLEELVARQEVVVAPSCSPRRGSRVVHETE